MQSWKLGFSPSPDKNIFSSNKRKHEIPHSPRSFLICFLLPFWCAVWPYWPNLEEREPIWGNNWLHSPSSDGLLAEVFLSCRANVRRSVHSPQDHFVIILIISDRCDWRDTWDRWACLGTQIGAGGTATLKLKFFWPQLMAPWIASLQIMLLHCKNDTGICFSLTVEYIQVCREWMPYPLWIWWKLMKLICCSFPSKFFQVEWNIGS